MNSDCSKITLDKLKENQARFNNIISRLFQAETITEMWWMLYNYPLRSIVESAIRRTGFRRQAWLAENYTNRFLKSLEQGNSVWGNPFDPKAAKTFKMFDLTIFRDYINELFDVVADLAEVDTDGTLAVGMTVKYYIALGCRLADVYSFDDKNPLIKMETYSRGSQKREEAILANEIYQKLGIDVNGHVEYKFPINPVDAERLHLVKAEGNDDNYVAQETSFFSAD